MSVSRRKGASSAIPPTPHTNGQPKPDTVPFPGLVAVPVEQFRAGKPVSWLLPGRVPLGGLTVLEGRKGQGKSSIAAALAAIVSAGAKFPGRRSRQRHDVVWLTGEESPRYELYPKLRAAGYGEGRVHVFGRTPNGSDSPVTLPACVPQLRTECVRLKARLVVIDPLASFVPEGYSLNGEQDVRRLLDPLGRMADELDLAVIVVRHVRKAIGGPLIDAGLGSVAIGAVARSILRVGPHGTEPGRYALHVVVCNRTDRTPALAYTLAGEPGAPRVVWGEELPLSADELADEGQDQGQRDKLAIAAEIIRDELGNDSRLAKEVLAIGEDAGISSSTMYLAKARLGVRGRKLGFGRGNPVMWLPPENGWPDAR